MDADVDGVEPTVSLEEGRAALTRREEEEAIRYDIAESNVRGTGRCP